MNLHKRKYGPLYNQLSQTLKLKRINAEDIYNMINDKVICLEELNPDMNKDKLLDPIVQFFHINVDYNSIFRGYGPDTDLSFICNESRHIIFSNHDLKYESFKKGNKEIYIKQYTRIYRITVYRQTTLS